MSKTHDTTSRACMRQPDKHERICQLMGGKLHTYTLGKESGASMRGAGLKEPAAAIDGAQWDRPKRRCSEKAIHDEPKVRWTEELPEIPA